MPKFWGKAADGYEQVTGEILRVIKKVQLQQSEKNETFKEISSAKGEHCQ